MELNRELTAGKVDKKRYFSYEQEQLLEKKDLDRLKKVTSKMVEPAHHNNILEGALLMIEDYPELASKYVDMISCRGYSQKGKNTLACVIKKIAIHHPNKIDYFLQKFTKLNGVGLWGDKDLLTFTKMKDIIPGMILAEMHDLLLVDILERLDDNYHALIQKSSLVDVVNNITEEFGITKNQTFGLVNA